MSNAEEAFHPIPRKVVHELVEGEVILIQLDRGTYFSLSGSGEPVWELLTAGATAESIGIALGRSDQERELIEVDVGLLIELMHREQLLEQLPDGGATGPGAEVALDGEWQRPVLERYDDMRDFLALDPIHEVAEAGWPAPKPAS